MAELFKLASPYFQAAGSAYTSYSTLAAGRAAEMEAKRRAYEDRMQGNAVMLEAGGQARNSLRRADLLASRAKAVAGASGAGVSDPTVTDIVSNIQGAGDYDAAASLFSGNYLAEGLRSRAGASENEGRAIRSASRVKAAATAFSDVTGFYEKYGPKKRPGVVAVPGGIPLAIQDPSSP